MKSCLKNVSDLRRLMGMLEYFHRFLEDYPKTARLIFDMLEKSKEKKQQNWKTRNNIKNIQLPSSTPVAWRKARKDALDRLNTAATTMTILSYPDSDQPFIFHTDAFRMDLVLSCTNNKKLAAIHWLQKQGGNSHWTPGIHVTPPPPR